MRHHRSNIGQVPIGQHLSSDPQTSRKIAATVHYNVPHSKRLLYWAYTSVHVTPSLVRYVIQSDSKWNRQTKQIHA